MLACIGTLGDGTLVTEAAGAVLGLALDSVACFGEYDAAAALVTSLNCLKSYACLSPNQSLLPLIACFNAFVAFTMASPAVRAG